MCANLIVTVASLAVACLGLDRGHRVDIFIQKDFLRFGGIFFLLVRNLTQKCQLFATVCL